MMTSTKYKILDRYPNGGKALKVFGAWVRQIGDRQGLSTSWSII
jgi:hypothetical protein